MYRQCSSRHLCHPYQPLDASCTFRSEAEVPRTHAISPPLLEIQKQYDCHNIRRDCISCLRYLRAGSGSSNHLQSSYGEPGEGRGRAGAMVVHGTGAARGFVLPGIEYGSSTQDSPQHSYFRQKDMASHADSLQRYSHGQTMVAEKVEWN
jgi:hypothetical protein